MAACVTYYYGECTWGCCQSASWVQEGWGNAGQWAGRAQARGFELTMIPTVGAVVIYAEGDGYSIFGHCGVVTAVGQDSQFLVHEMNYTAWAQYDDRWSSMYDVRAFILPPGVSPGGGGESPGAGGPGDIPPGTEDLIHQWWWFEQWIDVYMPQRNAELEGDTGAFGSI